MSKPATNPFLSRACRDRLPFDHLSLYDIAKIDELRREREKLRRCGVQVPQALEIELRRLSQTPRRFPIYPPTPKGAA